MKDVSKQSLHDLMTFIYRGEVNVTLGNLEDFLSTGKALEIRGLTDESYSQAFEPQTTMSPHNVSQYQSSHTLCVQSPANEKIDTDSVQSSCYQQQQPQHEYNGANSLDGNGYGAENHNDDDFYDDDIKNDDLLMDQNDYAQYDDWDADHGNATEEIVTQPSTPKVKQRVKRNNGELIHLVRVV